MQPLSETAAMRLCFLAAVALSLFTICQADPFYMPTIDDSAIIMRYLRNFQSGCFYCYNVADGPVYGISDFWYGIATGSLAWLGLAPQAALMIVSLLTCVLFFNAIFRIFYFVSGRIWLALGLGTMFYLSSRFIPMNLFNGLETPLHLWLVATTFLLLLQNRPRLFYLFAAASVISKLDCGFLIALMLLLNLLRARARHALRLSIRDGALCFVLPMILWAGFATWLFGSPVPQSFLSKMLLRSHAPRTSWFPFLEPLLDGTGAVPSMALALACGVLSVIVAWGRRQVATPSLVFAAASVGTLGLYFVYNPGEKMSWYYALPECLILMTVFLLPVDAARLPSRGFSAAGLAVSAMLACGVAALRFPMSQGLMPQVRKWNEVYERERMASGLLANQIRPRDHPVLWTGHGYPAYLFDGYVVDYSGLNTRAIWKAVKAVRTPTDATRAFLLSIGMDPDGVKTPDQLAYLATFELMQMFKPNVFMQHGLFQEPLQKTLGLRLAGSFYVIDLLGVPAFRVMVADPDHAELNHAIPLRDVLTAGGPAAKNDQEADGASFTLTLPARTGRLQFGIYRKSTAFDVTIEQAVSHEIIGTCAVPANPDARLPEAVAPCVVALSGDDRPLAIQITDSGAPMQMFEPVATQYLGTPAPSRLARNERP